MRVSFLNGCHLRLRQHRDAFIHHCGVQSGGDFMIKGLQQCVSTMNHRHRHPQSMHNACHLHRNITATHHHHASGQCRQMKHIVRDNAVLMTLTRQPTRNAPCGNQNARGFNKLTVTTHMVSIVQSEPHDDRWSLLLCEAGHHKCH